MSAPLRNAFLAYNIFYFHFLLFCHQCPITLGHKWIQQLMCENVSKQFFHELYSFFITRDLCNVFYISLLFIENCFDQISGSQTSSMYLRQELMASCTNNIRQDYTDTEQWIFFHVFKRIQRIVKCLQTKTLSTSYFT